MACMFNVGDVVEVVQDEYGYDTFLGMKGVVKDVLVDMQNNTIYGVDLYEGNLLYFLYKELKEVE